MNRQFVFTLVATGMLFLGILAGFRLKEGSAPTGAVPTGNSYFANLEKFQQVVQYVNENYFRPVNNDKLVEDAIQGMLTGLDPHTFYIPVSEMQEMREQMQGSYDGIGVEFNLVDDTIRVVAPLHGGPSEKLGILAGDRIVTIDGKTVAGIGITNNDVFKYLKGPKGTSVKVGIKRPGAKDMLDFTIKRDKIPVKSVDYAYMHDAATGYIKVGRFAETTHREFRESLRKLKSQGMQNLVLDLRDNPGGYMHIAQQMADDFLSEGKLVVYQEGRIPESKGRYEATDYYNEWEKGGLIVMIDEGSASASEIVSGAVQDWDRGLVVGTRSFGKGLVQQQQVLNDGSAIRVVIARYFTPSGRCIQKPFEEGKGNEYTAEIIKRYKSGEMYDPSKINFPDSLKYKTNSGRTVYGGGAIMPDVFVPSDTTAASPYLYQLFVKDQFRRFATKYQDTNPNLKAQYKDGFDYSNRFVVTDALMKEFTSFAAESGVPYVEKDYQKSKNNIRTRLKGLLGHNLYGDDGTYPVYLQADEQFQAALKLIPASRDLEKTGKFNAKLAEGVGVRPSPTVPAAGQRVENKN